MAEIKIEKKKPIWPWILLILIILAGVYYFWYYNDNMKGSEDQEMVEDSLQLRDEGMLLNGAEDSLNLDSGADGTEKPITDYIAYIENPQMGVDGEYTTGALVKLINATEAEGEQHNVDVTAKVKQAREDAFDITSEPDTSEQANKFKKSTNEISSALTTIQRDKFPELDAESVAVNDAANKIDAKIQVPQQKENINAFFEKAGTLLQKMNETEMNQQ